VGTKVDELVLGERWYSRERFVTIALQEEYSRPSNESNKELTAGSSGKGDTGCLAPLKSRDPPARSTGLGVILRVSPVGHDDQAG
jgi:hypothetical protein